MSDSSPELAGSIEGPGLATGGLRLGVRSLLLLRGGGGKGKASGCPMTMVGARMSVSGPRPAALARPGFLSPTLSGEAFNSRGMG